MGRLWRHSECSVRTPGSLVALWSDPLGICRISRARVTDVGLVLRDLLTNRNAVKRGTVGFIFVIPTPAASRHSLKNGTCN